MAITAVSGTTAKTTSTVLTAQTLDMQDFYKLLTAELKYQDPMNPTSNSEFMAQTAQFATLQEAQSTNDLLKTLSSNLLSSQMLSAAQAIGKFAKATTDSGDVTGMISGVAVDGADIKVTISGTSVKISQLTEVSQEE
jgi:flagellar basal-body rod modification protein FlgD